jgi:uncharacterized protein YndB with AHSA1/START domain
LEVRSDRSYRFAVPAEELWRALSRVEDYRTWWPWLRGFDGSSFEPGEAWHCVVQPPLPYSLRFRVILDDVEPARAASATITGDITGTARLEVIPAAGGCEARLVSRLSPASSMLRTIAVMARPVARFGHDWVLDSALRQFRTQVFPPTT